MNAQVENVTPIAPLDTQSNRFLVGTPNEVRFLEMAATDAGRRAFLGDAEQVDTQVGSAIINAQIKLRDSIETIEALVQDPTRNEVLKHEAAGVVANRMIDQLNSTKAKIEARALELATAAQDNANEHFAPKLERTSLESEIRGWIRENVNTPEGMAKVKAEALRSREVAAVMHHSPTFLLNLAPQVHLGIQLEVVQRHLPAAYKMLSDSVELTKLAPNYDKAIGSVRKSFYSPIVAAKAAKRVQI